MNINNLNAIPSGYQSAKANAEAIGARLVSHFETDDMAMTTVTSDTSKPKSMQELQEYLAKKYGVNSPNKTIEGIPASINVSTAFLQKALENPEKMQWLEENLEAMQSLNTGMFAGTLTQVSYSVDANGEITMITSGTSDPDGRIARENAERKRLEELEEKRLQEEKLQEKKLQEKKEQEALEEKKAFKESLQDSKQNLDFTFSISGFNVQAIQSAFKESLQQGIPQNHLNLNV